MRRYVVLQPHDLCVYTSPKGMMLWSWPVATTSAYASVRRRRRPHEFEARVRKPRGNELAVFRAVDDQERDDWIRRINEAGVVWGSGDKLQGRRRRHKRDKGSSTGSGAGAGSGAAAGAADGDAQSLQKELASSEWDLRKEQASTTTFGSFFVRDGDAAEWQQRYVFDAMLCGLVRRGGGGCVSPRPCGCLCVLHQIL